MRTIPKEPNIVSPMDIEDLKAHIGEELWLQACDWAWKGAVLEHRGEGYDETDPANAPHELEMLIWDTEGMSCVQRVELAFELYRAMPCYGNLMFIRNGYDALSRDKDAKRLFWDQYRNLLSGENEQLAEPVANTLFVDYFEDPDTVEESWEQLAGSDELNERGLQRVLEESGPVPWHLKAHLFRRLVRDQTWHGWIFQSLVSSTFAGFGDIDVPAAAKILAQTRASRRHR